MSTKILEELQEAVLKYDKEKTAHLAEETIGKKIDPLEVLDTLTIALRQVGDGFGTGELWLPDLIGAAGAVTTALPIIEQEIKNRGMKRETLGTVAIGTVYGDIHDIGKAMVAALLVAEGFAVHDLGINVPAEDFVGGVKEHNADILAMSALMTMTAPEQKKVIETLKEEGLRDRVKIMVGGGAITQDFADSIGADGYEPTAPLAVKLARQLLGK